MSEKTYALSQSQNTFVFDVPITANKQQIMAAVDAQFNVTSVDARMIVMKGKTARSIRLGGKARKNVSGKRADVKKAYVRLKEGDSIPIFAAVEEAEQAEAKAAEKAAKKAAKEKK
jgi:large subunit ribosomal protein L23